MAKEAKKFKANYNGEPVRPGEVMVPFEFTEPDCAGNVTNPECIRTLHMGGRSFKVVYKAVPAEQEKLAKSALNLTVNEQLGHYFTPNSFSLDAVRDEDELELAVVESAEDMLMKAESLKGAAELFKKKVKLLINENAKIGYALLLAYSKVKGEEFYTRMRLSQSNADAARHKAEDILKEGLFSFNPKELRCYRSKWDEVYRQEALELLDKIISDLF